MNGLSAKHQTQPSNMIFLVLCDTIALPDAQLPSYDSIAIPFANNIPDHVQNGGDFHDRRELLVYQPHEPTNLSRM